MRLFYIIFSFLKRFILFITAVVLTIHVRLLLGLPAIAQDTEEKIHHPEDNFLPNGTLALVTTEKLTKLKDLADAVHDPKLHDLYRAVQALRANGSSEQRIRDVEIRCQSRRLSTCAKTEPEWNPLLWLNHWENWLNRLLAWHLRCTSVDYKQLAYTHIINVEDVHPQSFNDVFCEEIGIRWIVWHRRQTGNQVLGNDRTADVFEWRASFCCAFETRDRIKKESKFCSFSFFSLSYLRQMIRWRSGLIVLICIELFYRSMLFYDDRLVTEPISLILSRCPCEYPRIAYHRGWRPMSITRPLYHWYQLLRQCRIIHCQFSLFNMITAIDMILFVIVLVNLVNWLNTDTCVI